MDHRPVRKPLKGWLRRKAGRIATWSRKWFVLDDKFLFIFAREDDLKHQDVITLYGQVLVEPPMDPVEPKLGYFDIVSEPEKGSQTILSLCAESEEDKKIWMRAFKQALYAEKGGAVFSQSLEETLYWSKQAGQRIPYIVDECVEYLYKYGLETEGIFRITGKIAMIRDVISRFEQGQLVRFEEEGTDVHVVASVFKTFLRDLPDSIIPCSLFQKFMHIALCFTESSTETAKNKCVGDLTESMKDIPEDNYIILKYICHFLREVGLCQSKNKMSMMNLGTVFGNNIIRHIDKENSQLIMCTAELGQNLVYMLLEYFAQVFVLEYSEHTRITNKEVPTDDLLRMSRMLDIPVAQPSEVVSPSVLADLEGIDLNIDSSSHPSCSSTGSLQFLENHYQDAQKERLEAEQEADDNVFAERKPEKQRLKNRLDLSLPLSGETSESNSSPASPLSQNEQPPIPPRRTKSSKLSRSKRVSDRRRPDGIHVAKDDKSPRTPEGVNSEDVLMALAKANCLPPGSPRLPRDSPLPPPPVASSEDSENSMGVKIPANSLPAEGDGKVMPSTSDLQNQVSLLKKELTVQREHYKKQVTALTSQLKDMHEKYEHRIKTMEVETANQRRELESRLELEQSARMAAVATGEKLKEVLHHYQMQYGELSPQ